jgi:LPS-assembly lipoprotein
MSLSKKMDPSRRSFLKVLGVVALPGLAAAGCQVRPLYGSLDMSTWEGQSVPDELAAIEIEPISNQYSTEDTTRELYNELVFRFERGTTRPEKRYRLKVVIDLNSSEIGVEQLADIPAAYTMTMNASFVLSEKATDKTLMTGRSFATASYDFSNQRFANLRAKKDAEERAARAVADDIQARIAGHFASQS